MKPCLIDLSSRAKFRLTGADRERYLNGQVTNQVKLATPEKAIEACVCNVKGKLEGVVHITRSADGEAFWIDGPPELRDSLFARLGRYIIADDCELEDVTDDFGLVHALGEWPDLPGAVWKASNRWGMPGVDLWVERDSLPKILSAGAPMDAEALEDLRIRNGIPRWGAEWNADTLPAEVRLDERAVDFHKGCYVGQEVVSRLESVGRVNRLLVAIEAITDGGVATVGAEVFSADDSSGEKPSGMVTSVTSDGRRALAIVKRDLSEPETKLVLRENEGKLGSQIWEVRTLGSGGA
ncbi:MAG: folate-binding protein YgfZ [Verrucomicrobiae bacterium]|nr:folate-binding protein YgfZ [Verrucomicrobiae bacterium]